MERHEIDQQKRFSEIKDLLNEGNLDYQKVMRNPIFLMPDQKPRFPFACTTLLDYFACCFLMVEQGQEERIRLHHKYNDGRMRYKMIEDNLLWKLKELGLKLAISSDPVDKKLYGCVLTITKEAL